MAEPTVIAICSILGFSGTTSSDFASSFTYARLAEVEVVDQKLSQLADSPLLCAHSGEW
jgi:cellobiose-specific phosphotransferase system component IIA